MSLSTKTTKFLVSTVVALGLAGAVSAGNKTFLAADSNWNNGSNWDPSGVPVDGDHVIIPDDKICHVDITNARADSFEVQTGGALIIDAGKLLEIDSNSSVAQAQGMQLAGSDSRLKISGNLTLSGAGTLQGKNSAAKIEVVSSFTLKNTSTIEGVLQIMGSGTFTNGDGTGGGGDGGVVNANLDAGGTLELASTLTLGVDEDDSEWRCSDADATLLFSVGSASLNGSFYLEAGVLYIFAAIDTNGDMVQDGGLLHIDQNFDVALYHFDAGTGNLANTKHFFYTSFSSDTPLSNPSTGPSGISNNTGNDYTWPV